MECHRRVFIVIYRHRHVSRVRNQAQAASTPRLQPAGSWLAAILALGFHIPLVLPLPGGMVEAPTTGFLELGEALGEPSITPPVSTVLTPPE